MLLHDLKYELLATVREKSLMFWLILFPIILGTFFKLAFGGIYESTTVFNTVPAAVVEVEENRFFNMVLDSVGDPENESQLLDVTKTDEATALDMLEKGEVSGIIYVGETLSLTVKEDGMDQSILKAFLEQYSHNEEAIMSAMSEDPVKLPLIITAMMNDDEICREVPVTDAGNTDNMVSYFYNLIAMVAMYGSLLGIGISTSNQANLSPLGARKCCSPTPKLIGLCAALISRLILQTGCMVICVTFLRFVLKIDFGARLPLVYASAILGGCVGVAMGFCISSIGSMSENVKTGLALTGSMVSCFLSGLMVGNMKPLLAQHAPWFNNINPAAVVCDSFYCLNMFDDYGRFITKLITMAVTIVIFTALGFIMTRRKKYASL